MEQLTLNNPIVPPQINGYEVGGIHLDYKPISRVVITVIGSDGFGKLITREGDEARTLIVSLNKANLTIKSLAKRVLEWCASVNELPAGNVTGTIEQ